MYDLIYYRNPCNFSIIKSIVLAIIINAIWGLGKKAVKTRKLLIS